MRSLPLKKFKYPEFPFKKIVPMEFFIRGTSTAYSEKGGRFTQVGWPEKTRRPDEAGAYNIHLYRVPPKASSHEAWADRFEATMHAAVERALFHSKLIAPQKLEKPMNLPVLAFVLRPSVKLTLTSRELVTDLTGDVPARREMYERALVRGKPKRTFPEAILTPMDLMNPLVTQVLRVELTRKEYKGILRNAARMAKAAGHDFKARLKKHVAETKTIDKLKGMARGKKMDELKKDGWDLVRDVTGHSKPPQLMETGAHAHNAFAYYVGELVKKKLLKKAYAAMSKAVAEEKVLKASEGD